MIFATNVLVSALLISFSAWLSGRFPTTAGFIVALPLSSMLVLPLSYFQHSDAAGSALLARSIFVAIPISLTFFVPFLLSDRLGLGFWPCYALGCAALPVAYFVHRVVARTLL